LTTISQQTDTAILVLAKLNGQIQFWNNKFLW